MTCASCACSSLRSRLPRRAAAAAAQALAPAPSRPVRGGFASWQQLGTVAIAIHHLQTRVADARTTNDDDETNDARRTAAWFLACLLRDRKAILSACCGSSGCCRSPCCDIGRGRWTAGGSPPPFFGATRKTGGERRLRLLRWRVSIV